MVARHHRRGDRFIDPQRHRDPQLARRNPLPRRVPGVRAGRRGGRGVAALHRRARLGGHHLLRDAVVLRRAGHGGGAARDLRLRVGADPQHAPGQRGNHVREPAGLLRLLDRPVPVHVRPPRRHPAPLRREVRRHHRGLPGRLWLGRWLEWGKPGQLQLRYPGAQRGRPCLADDSGHQLCYGRSLSHSH